MTLLLLALLQDPIADSEYRDLLAAVVPSAPEPWQTIPWRLSLWSARRDAAAARKPIFLYTMNGHPLGGV